MNTPGHSDAIVTDYFELLPELGMGRPFAADMVHLTWHGSYEITDCGAVFSEALELETTDSESSFLVLEGDPFDLTPEILKHGGNGSPLNLRDAPLWPKSNTRPLAVGSGTNFPTKFVDSEHDVCLSRVST